MDTFCRAVTQIHTSSSACKDWNSVRKTVFYLFYLFLFPFLPKIK